MKKSILLIALFAFSTSAFAKRGGWERLPDAVYTVPVDDEALKPFATFPLPDFKRRVDNGRIEVEYTLPIELAGKDIPLEASGVETQTPYLQGENIKMFCENGDCRVNYPDLPVTAEEVRAFHEASGAPAVEVNSRMQVFARFRGGDPAGVIHLNGSPTAE